MISVFRKLPVAVGLIAAGIVSVGGCSRTPQQKYTRFLESGKKHADAQDYSRAILDFQNAIKAQPKQAEPYYRLGLVYFSRAQVKEAIVSLRSATEVDPSYAPAQLKLAELMIMTHNDQLVKDAEARVHKVLTGNPSDNDALFMLAATQAQLRKPEDAERYLNDILAKTPQHLRSAIALAQMKLSARDIKGAEEILKKTVTQSPNSPDAAVALGSVYAGAGKMADAEALFRRAVQLDPKNASALVGLASLQVKSGNMREAEQTYKGIARLPQKEHKLAYAVFLMQQNRREDAVTELERLVKADPQDRIARSGLVAGYLATNRPEKAEALLNDVLKKNGRDSDALVQRSQIYLQNGKYVEADRDLQVVIRGDPGSAQAHYLMSKVYRSRGALLQQKQELTQALRIAPESLRVRFDLANALLMTNNAGAALTTLNEAQPEQKRTIPYLIARNWALIALGEQAAARKGVDAVLAVTRIPDVLLQDGMLKLAAQDFTGARKPLEEVLKADPEDLRAMATLAQTYVSQKQPAVAGEKIRQYVAQRPKSARLQMFWANWLIENGRKAEARDPLVAAKLADPKSPAPSLILARLDLEDGNIEQARRTLSGVIAADERNTDAHMLAAMIEEAANDPAKAIDHYRKVIAVDDSDVLALNNLAYTLSRNGIQLDEAMKYAQKAKELSPESSHIRDTLGWIYYRRGMYQMAAKELEGALAKGARPSVQFHLGMAYKQLGNAEKGGRLLAAALAVDPKLADTEVIR